MMKEILLPDFDDMVNLASEIGNKQTRLMVLQAKLDVVLAQITDTTTTSEAYWVGGKPPSNAHIKDNYHVLGINDETRSLLWEIRHEMATLAGELKTAEALFRVYENMIGVWRTQSANSRYES